MKLNKFNSLKFAVTAASLLFFIQAPVDKRERSSDRLIESAANNGIQGAGPDSQLIIYKKVRDSLEKIVYKKKISMEIPTLFRLSPVGVTQMYDFSSDTEIVKSFFTIKGFALKKNSNIVIEKDNYFLEKVSGIHQTNSGKEINGPVYRTKINALPCYLYPGDKGLTLLFPVSNRSYKWIKTIMDLLLWALLIANIVIIARVINVLRNISKGESFLPENSRYLSWAGWAIVILNLSAVLIPFIIRLIFLPGIPHEIYYPFWSSFFDVKWGLLVGIALLVTARAFKNGYDIQQEQELTV